MRTFTLVLVLFASLPAISAPRQQQQDGNIFDWMFNGFRDRNQQQQQRPQLQRPDQRVQPGNAQTQVSPYTAFKDPDTVRAVTDFRTQPRIEMPVTVTATEWSDSDEKEYEKFVTTMGKAVSSGKCGSVRKCMRNPEANPYAASDSPDLIMYSDCGDLPYMLRTYFAYKKHLPFSVVTAVMMNQQPSASSPSDPRNCVLLTNGPANSPYGNSITNRGQSNVPKAPGRERNFVEYWTDVMDSVFSGTYRVGALNTGAVIKPLADAAFANCATPGKNPANERGPVATLPYDKADIYPVKISRDGVRAGTIVHTTGHIYVVWSIDQQGHVHVIDAHPDGSMTGKKIIMKSTLDRSRPDQGLGFYRFRPLRLVGAQKYNGNYYGGTIVPATDDELFQKGLFSLEQYFGPNSTVAPRAQVALDLWVKGFRTVDFFDLLDTRMRAADYTVSADVAVADLMKALCEEMKQRVDDVSAALVSNVALNTQQHPLTLPQDIFSSTGPWEDFSTPGRDSRMKALVSDIVQGAILKYQQSHHKGWGLSFNGTAADYQKALRQRLVEVNSSCAVTYQNTAGRAVQLSFNNVIARLERLSFDPYHCAEKRWGASGQELSACADQDGDNTWYDAEANMRRTAGKTNPQDHDVLNIRSNKEITLEMLRDNSLIDQPSKSEINLGSRKPLIKDLDAVFASPNFLKALDAEMVSQKQ